METLNGRLFGICTLLLLGAAFVFGANTPTAPSALTPGVTSTFDPDDYGVQSHEAIAGNITALVLYGIGQTKSWQGYYGNVSATITLDDASEFTFYNWSAAEPRGQIYATLNDTVAWSGVQCFNFSNTSAANWDTIETYYNIAVDDVDGVNETFTAVNHPTFEVASRTMTGCPTTYIFQNDAEQTTNFVNVLLFDPADNNTGWIYTTLIEDKDIGVTSDIVCYNNVECDFQILVNEDGHGTDTATTTYYFWVELL